MADDFLWWRDGVIYQIYPRSFADSSGSGIGDLKGITEHLEYLKNLGVNGIWLSPINPSPDVDFGYDVSDYCAIDPKFGSMADFDRLIKEAGDLGIKVILDLVLNHSSDRHPWFEASRSSRENPYRDWYLWRDPNDKGGLPNNWQSIFGGKGWEWDEHTRQFYFHMFYKEQPDFNWRNPNVRQALLDVFRFWLDKGVKGFRLDVFNAYFKEAQFRSNPVKMFGIRPFERQIHKYDSDQPELMGVLADIRNLLDKYPQTYVVGETFLSTPQKAATYCGDGILHAAFNFKFLENPWNPARFTQIIQEWENALGDQKWPNYVLNNHDIQRSATRYGQEEDDERLKVAAAMLLTLRGTPFIYYGEEIGMRDIRVKRADIQDPIGKRYWPFFKGRDGCRAPMQWDASLNAGFSKGKPWLPLHPDYRERNVQAQLRDKDSLLNFYKRLLALRRQHPVLTRGSFNPIQNMPTGVMVYERCYEGSIALMLLNFHDSSKTVQLVNGSPTWQMALSNQRQENTEIQANRIQLGGNETLVLLSK